MELHFLIVDPIQNIFEIRHRRKWRDEIIKKSLVEEFLAISIGCLVENSLDVFKD